VRLHPVLHQLAMSGMRLGLDRTRDLLAALGDPHLAVPVVHVAGTNGKGSVVRMIGATLRAQGLRVGEMTSPHLQHINERLHIDGAPISDARLDALLHRVADARGRWAAAHAPDLPADQILTYFELITVAGFVLFAEEGVDVAVIEVGLGGRLDATNVVAPVATAITSIGIDHVEQLGPDVGSIAAEKAGIIKPRVPVVVGPLPAQAARVIRTIAHDREAPLLAPEVDYRVSQGRDGAISVGVNAGPGWPAASYGDLRLGLDGDHQLANAGVAVALGQVLPAGLRPSPSAVSQGLAEVRHAGRMEWLAPDLLVDCAHNPDGAARLAAAIRALPEDRRPRSLLFGASEDKDARGIVVTLAPLVERIYVTHCAHPRSARAGDLAARLVGIGVPLLPAGPVEDALPVARARGPVLVAGSIFLVGAVRDLVTG